MRIIFIATFLSLFCFHANAANSWYWGKVIKIQTLGEYGSFYVYLDNENVKSNCLNNRVEFTVNNMGIERTKSAFALALSAFAAGKEWGVVIDLPTSEATCSASPTATQGAGIQ